jgi:hypothetical protein
MCPACGSIDLNLMTVVRPSPAVWTTREGVTAEDWRKLSEREVS